MHRLRLITCALLVFAGPGTGATQPRAQLLLADRHVAPGQAVRVEIRIAATGALVAAPQLPLSDGLRLTHASYEATTTPRLNRVSHTFEIVADRPGTYTIGPATVAGWDSTTNAALELRTASATLTVSPPALPRTVAATCAAALMLCGLWAACRYRRRRQTAPAPEPSTHIEENTHAGYHAGNHRPG